MSSLFDRHRSLLPTSRQLAAAPTQPTLQSLAAVIAHVDAGGRHAQLLNDFVFEPEPPDDAGTAGQLDTEGVWHPSRCRRLRQVTGRQAVVRLRAPVGEQRRWRLCLDCSEEQAGEGALGWFHTLGHLALVDELTDVPFGFDRWPAADRLAYVHHRLGAVGNAARDGFFLEHLETEHTVQVEDHLEEAAAPLLDACRDQQCADAFDTWMADIDRTRRQIAAEVNHRTPASSYTDGRWVALSGYVQWTEPTTALVTLLGTVARDGRRRRVCVVPAAALRAARADVPRDARWGDGSEHGALTPATRLQDGEDVVAPAPTAFELVVSGMAPAAAWEAARRLCDRPRGGAQPVRAG